MYGPNKEAAACACDDDQAILKPTNPLPNSTFHHKQQTKSKSKKNQKTIKSHPTHNGYKKRKKEEENKTEQSNV